MIARVPLQAASWGWPLGFGLAATLLGSYELGAESLWVDEAASAGFALGGAGAWMADHNMALYYMLLGGWVRVFGITEVALRAPSVLCFAASAAVLYRLVELRFGSLAARIAASLFVTNAFLLELAQEARGYSLALLLTLVAQVALTRVLASGGVRWAFVYGISLGLAVYAHLFSLWILAANVAACCTVRAPRRDLLLAGAVAALISVPLCLQIAGAGTAQVSWIRPVSWRSLLALPVIWTGGSVWLALVCACLFVWFARDLGSADARVRREAWLIIAWLMVPLAATLLVSWLVAPMLLPKYLVMGVPALHIGAAVTLARAPRKWLGGGLALLLLLAAPCLVRVFAGPKKEPWRDAVQALAAGMRPNEPLLLWLPCPEPFHYYVERLGLSNLAPARWPARPWGFPVPEEGPLTQMEALTQLAHELPERVWTVSNRSPEPPSLGPLAPDYRLEQAQRFSSLPNRWDPLFADDAARVIHVRSWVRRR